MYDLFLGNAEVVLTDYEFTDLGEIVERGVSPARCAEFLLGGSC